MEKTNASAFTIYNLDESGCTTTQRPPKVIAPKGQKQVGQITSQERGELVTICGIVAANGSSIPPVFVFPRKNFKDFMMIGAPEGSLGLASGNGWMNCESFKKVIEHFIKFTNSSMEHQVILILDNHQSHLSIAALELAKKNGVHIITLPPHTSHKTQPLDRSVFGPMKTYFNSAANSLMLQNTGKNITIYNMASLMNEAWTRAATPGNIMSGFRASGIWPLNEHIFEDHEFLPSDVTDRLLNTEHSPSSTEATTSASSASTPATEASSSATHACTSVPITSTSATEACTSATNASTTSEDESNSGFISPAIFRGYPKISQEKQTGRRNRKRGKTMLATSTPELERMKSDMTKKDNKNRFTKAKKKLRLDIDSDSDDMSLDIHDVCVSSSEEEISDNNEAAETLELGHVDHPKKGDFVICEYSMKTKIVYYIGKVSQERDSDDELEIEFYRKKMKISL